MEISSLIDPGVIQYWQDHFCQANGMYMLCVDSDFQIVSKPYGEEGDWQRIKKMVGEHHFESLFDHVKENRIENMVEEETDCSWMKLCALSINVSGQVQLTWVIAALIYEKMDGSQEEFEGLHFTTEEQFYRTIEFLSVMTRQFFAAKMSEYIAQEAMHESVAAEKKVKEQLHRSEVMTEIVRRLESENTFAKIVDDIIRDVCKCLDIHEGCLIQENQEGMVDMVCEYCAVSEDAGMAHYQNISKEIFPFFDGKSYFISSKTALNAEFQTFFRNAGLTAGVFLPIFSQGSAVMYLCFCDKNQSRNWSVEEIKFINDVKHVVQGIFSKRMAKNSLASSYASLEAILENTGCGLHVVDPKTRTVLYMNQRFKELFPHTIEVGKLDDLLFAQRDMERSFQEVYVSLEDRWVDVNKTRIKWVDGRDVTLCTVYDVTDKKDYQKKIESQANNDFLTGLFNRMRCEQDLGAFLHQIKQEGGEGALLYIDLDDFKHINDGLGHQYGDVLLKAISKSISRVRGVERTCYRIGGDEFIVIVTKEYFSDLMRICNDIRSIFQKPWYLKGEDYYCTMCMGVVCFPTDAGTVEEVIRNADLALLAAKKKGKGHVEFYNDAENTSLPFHRLDLEKNMRKATMNAMSEFEVYYQPVMLINQGEDQCCGAEALVRWNSTEMGFVSPADFIPVAEYLGLINPIGEYVLRQAAQHCKNWNDMGHPDYHINVNLSVVQLLQNDIVKKVRNVITETGIDPHNLRLEVTESLAIDDLVRMKMILSQIKALGVGVALDDFGTGYSSLNHIRELPIDIIKIDKCFIDHIAEDDFSESFVKMVAELAAAIGVEVCVEGVESTSQYEKVKATSVQMIQGYYFGKPMRIEEFEKQYL